jgi:hypothetical protein
VTPGASVTGVPAVDGLPVVSAERGAVRRLHAPSVVGGGKPYRPYFLGLSLFPLSS